MIQCLYQSASPTPTRRRRQRRASCVALGIALMCGVSSKLIAQQLPQAPSRSATAVEPAPRLPADYVIGVSDVLVVEFWKEKDLSAEVVVRPDGMISLPILNDVKAVGLTPEELGKAVGQAATKFVRDAGATVMVKSINSRRVYVIGEVASPGAFPLNDGMNVLQALAQAGGFLEHSNKGDIAVVRVELGQERRFKFNYNEVVRGRNTQQNITLMPGDTVIVR